MIHDNITPAWKTAALYLAFGIAWILFSDHLINQIANNNPNRILWLQGMKGIFFVVASAILLFVTTLRFYRQYQHALATSHAACMRYKALYETISDGVVEYDLQSDRAVINEALRQQLGQPEAEIPAFAAFNNERLHPDDREQVANRVAHCISMRQQTIQVEYRYRMQDNRYHRILSRGYFSYDEVTGTPIRYVGTFNDITELTDIKNRFLAQESSYRQQTGTMILRAQEAERNRWAMELHDNVCQMLTVVKLYLEQAQISNTDPFVAKASTLVVGTLQAIRQMSFSLKPPEFKSTSLLEAVEMLSANIMNAYPLQIEVHSRALAEEHINDDHRLLIYRIVQEQLNNIVKHAQASSVKVLLTTDPNTASVQVIDDGVGFDQKEPRLGIGLRNMQSRLELFKGELRIESGEGLGCRVAASFSLQ